MSRRFLPLFLLVCLVGLSLPATRAQDPPTATFTSPDGRLTLAYPQSWALDDLTPRIPEGSPQEIAIWLRDQQGIEVYAHLLNAANAQTNPGPGPSIGSNPSPTGVLNYSYIEADFADFGPPEDPEPLTINGRAAVRINHFPERTSQENQYLAVDLGNGYFFTMKAIMGPEMLDEYQDTLLAILESVQFDAMLRGTVTLPAPEPGTGAVQWRVYAPVAPGEGSLGYPNAVAIGPEGLIYLTTDVHPLLVLNPDGTVAYTLDNPDIPAYTHSLAVAADGTIWVPDYADREILQLDNTGNRVNRIGYVGSGDFSPAALTFSPAGALVVLEVTVPWVEPRARIRTLEPSGEELSVFPVDIADATLIVEPMDPRAALAVGPEGRIFVGSALYSELLVFAPDGTLLFPEDPTVAEMTIVGPTFGALDAQAVNALAIAPDGTVYVSLYRASGILAFDATGAEVAAYREAFDTRQGGDIPPGAIASPRGLAVAPDGSLVVVDSDGINAQVMRLAPLAPPAD